MASLYFHIGADFDNIIRLKKEIKEIKEEMRSFDASTDVKGLKVLETRLQTAQKEFDSLAVAAVKAGHEMEQNFKKKIFDASQAVNGFTDKIIAQKNVVKDVEADVRRLGEAYRLAAKNNPMSATSKLSEYNASKRALEGERAALFGLTQEQAKSRLSVKSLRDEYSLYKNDSTKVVSANEDIAGSLKHMVLAVAGADAIKDFISNIIDVAGNFQKMEAVLTNSLGSNSKAKEAIDMLSDFGADTPFQVNELTSSFVKLANQGFTPTIDQMRKLGDLASSTGKSFDQLTEAIIDAQVGENERLKEFGIRASKSGDTITYTFKEQQTTVKNTASAIREYILSLGDLEGVVGANEKISATFVGRLSNIENELMNQFKDFGEKFNTELSTGINLTGSLVENLNNIIPVIGGLVTAYGSYKAAVLAVSAAYKAGALYENIRLIAMMRKEIGLATAAQQAFNVASKANIYAALISLLLGLGAAVYMFTRRTKEASKVQESLADLNNKVTEEFSKQSATIDRLNSVLKSETSSIEQKKKSLSELQAIIPSYNAKLDEEGKLINNNTEAIKSYLTQLEKQIKLKAAQEELENLYRQKRLQEKEVQEKKAGVESATKNIPDVVYGGESGIEYQRHMLNAAGKAEGALKKANLELNTTKRLIGEIEKEIELSTSSTTEIIPSSISKEITDATKKVSDLKQELTDLRSGKTSVEAGKTVKEVIEGKVKDLKAAEDALSTLTGKDKGSIKEAADRLKTKQEQADILLEISRNAKERENAERQTSFEIEQAKIDVMKDGFLKEQTQIELNHHKSLQGITLRGEEMLKAQQEVERKLWEKDGKKGVFTPKTTSVSQLPTDQLEQLAGLMNGIVAKTNYDNQTLIDGMVKQYQTYTEKRKEIEDKFDAEIKAMQANNTNGQFDANIIEAKKQKTEDLAEIDNTVIANKSMWARLFADTSAMSKKQIKQIMAEIKQLTDYLEGISIIVPTGFTPESLEQLKKDPEKIRAIYDELIEKQDELDSRTDYPYSGIIKGFGKLKDAAELARKATKAVSEEERKVFEYQAESAKAKGMEYIKEGATAASDSVSMLADRLKELAEATGDERFSESAEQFGALAQNLGAAAKGFQSGGWIGAIIGGATDMLTQTFQAITTAKAEVKEFETNRLDFLSEYNLLLLKNKMSTEDQDNVFGSSALKRASQAAKAAQDAMAQYTEEITRRTAPEIKKEFKNLGAAIFGMNPFTSANFLGFGKKISNETKTLQAAFEKGYSDLQSMAVKTKDRSGWANFWGKQDEYTSLKDLAPQLWDETGDFDIEAAKVFLDTNTQISDEQRKQIQNVIDLKDVYNEAMQILRDDVADTFGSLGDGLLDSIESAVRNGDIAMDKFADSVAGTFEKLGRKIAYELHFQKEFDKLQEQLVATYDQGDSEDIANKQMQIVSDFYDKIGKNVENAEAWMEAWKKKAEEKGFDLWTKDEETEDRKATAKGFSAMSQDSADALDGKFSSQLIFLDKTLGQVTTISEQMSFIRDLQVEGWEDVRAIKDLSEKISENTGQIAEIAGRIENISTKIESNTGKAADSVQYIKDNGLLLKR